MKMPEEKPPNHERWIISYADFTTLLLATFVVMYAVSSINSSKFQEMAEAFNTAFIGRTTSLSDAGFAAANKGPFTQMPSPVHVPVVTREEQIKNLPPALRQDQPAEMKLDSNNAAADGRSGGGSLRDRVERRVQSLDEAYDRLSKALAALIDKGQVRVSLQSLGVVIDINEILLFNSGKAQLTPAALALVDEVAQILKGLDYQIQVNGFTDDTPIHNQQFDSNWDLSAMRAVAVVKRFAAAGIDPKLLVGAGFGEYHPVAGNDTAEGRAQNRRVSIVVVSPLQGSDPVKTKLLGSAAERSRTAGEATPAAAAPAPAQAAAPAPDRAPGPIDLSEPVPPHIPVPAPSASP
jgi:chemotaxis protein MotB